MSVNMNIKIEKCPFCGGKSKVYAYLDTPEEVAAAWNKRAYTLGVDIAKGGE